MDVSGTFGADALFFSLMVGREEAAGASSGAGGVGTIGGGSMALSSEGACNALSTASSVLMILAHSTGTVRR